jgi:hypothetical protein
MRWADEFSSDPHRCERLGAPVRTRAPNRHPVKGMLTRLQQQALTVMNNANLKGHAKERKDTCMFFIIRADNTMREKATHFERKKDARY